MSLAITVNGTAQYGSGAYSTYSIVPAVAVNPASVGVVQLVGEAPGGPPGLTILTNPSQCSSTFGNGALSNGALLAFNPAQTPASPDGADDIPGGAFRVQAYKVNQSTQSTLQAPMATPAGQAYTIDTGSTTTAIVYAAATFTANQYNGAWLRIGTETRRVTATSTTTLTVSPGFSAAPTNGTASTVLATSMTLTSIGYGIDQNSLAFEFEASATPRKYILTMSRGGTLQASAPICGTPYMRVMYTNGAIPANGTGTITAVTTTTVTVNVAAAPSSNAFAGMVLQLPTGLQRLISANTNADPTVITLDPLHAMTAAQVAAITIGSTANVRNVTSAVAAVGATTMTTTAALAGQSLSLTYSTLGIETIGELVDYLNANTSYYAEIADGIASDTALADFDFGTYSNNLGVDVRFDFGVEDVEITGDSASYYAIPLSTWTPNPLKRSRFFQDVATLVAYINEFSDLATASRNADGVSTYGGSYLPAVTGGSYLTQRDSFLYFTGGTAGASTNANWQTAFDDLLDVRSNSICALISEDLGHGSTATYDSVAAQFALHIQQRNNGSTKNEAGGYIGFEGNKAELIAQARAFNSPHIHIFGQEIQFLDVDGELDVGAPELLGPIAAGMRAGGIEVGTPLTKKALRVTAVTNHEWDANDIQTVNDLTAAGVMFAQDTSETGGVGIRWNRDRTTWVASDNDILADGNMAEELRFLVYDFRTRIENRFVGKKNAGGTDNAPPTITQISNASYEFLDLYRAPPYRILTASADPENPSVIIKRGFDRVAVRSSGNTTRISFRAFLAPGIVFILPEITVAVPSISA